MTTVLELSAIEQTQRVANVVPGSATDGVPYTPITPAPHIYTLLGRSNNYGAGRRNNRSIRLLIDHCTQGSSTSIVPSMRYDARRQESVSATAFVGEDGIGYSVPEEDRPWTTGRWNDESLSCETVGFTAWSAEQWRNTRPQTILNKILLLTDWCTRYNIPPVWLTAAQIAEGASRQSLSPVQGVNLGICDHLEANRAAILLGGNPSRYSHTDIGPGMRTVMLEDILPAVVANLTPPDPGIPDVIDPPKDEPMLPYLFQLPDGGIGIRDAQGSRSVNTEEIAAGGPLADMLPAWPATGNAASWIRRELDKYQRELDAPPAVTVPGTPTSGFTGTITLAPK